MKEFIIFVNHYPICCCMTKKELLQRLQDIEWEDFEVKEAVNTLPKNIWETVSAFANTAGGWIVLGVAQRKKRFEVKGVEEVEKLEQEFTTALRSRNKFNVVIVPECRKYDVEEKRYWLFIFLHLR